MSVSPCSLPSVWGVGTLQLLLPLRCCGGVRENGEPFAQYAYDPCCMQKSYGEEARRINLHTSWTRFPQNCATCNPKHMLRGSLRGLAGASVAAGAGAYGVARYGDDETQQRVAIGVVGTLARIFLRGLNNFTMHESHHLDCALARPKGTALLSVSNHIATIDDPHLLSAIVPYWVLADGSSEMRWGVCASDVCFRPGSMLSRLADCAKVLPIQRHGGVWQPELEGIIAKLREGAWVHYFPEGKIRQDGRIHPFRRGVGRLAASVGEGEELQVLPFYHEGTSTIQPTTPTAKTIFTRPNLGTDVHVIFGAPVDLSRLLALRGEPPFDRRVSRGRSARLIAS